MPEARPSMVDRIPVAHTPPGGYGEVMPPPVLTGCDDALVAGAPDLRGLWQVELVRVGGLDAPEHAAMGLVQRIEQCGDRLVVTSAGVIHDMRVDGTVDNGVHGVAGADFATEITVVATFEVGVHVLRPLGFDGIEITRRLDGDRLRWDYLGFVSWSRRLGPADAKPPTT